MNHDPPVGNHRIGTCAGERRICAIAEREHDDAAVRAIPGQVRYVVHHHATEYGSVAAEHVAAATIHDLGIVGAEYPDDRAVFRVNRFQ